MGAQEVALAWRLVASRGHGLPGLGDWRMEIAGSRVVVTGAAGGVGAAICRHLAVGGARVVLSGRNEAALAGLAGEIAGDVVVADLCNTGDVGRLAGVAGGADALVLNAGVGFDPAIGDVTPADIDTMLDTNLRAPATLAVSFVQACLSERRRGAVVFIGSVAGVTATPGTRMYNASKFGLRGLALSMHQELYGTGVSATHVAPGFISGAGMFADSGMALPPGVRTSTPAEVAVAVERAIRKGPAEVFVAPTELRVGAVFAGAAPRTGAAILRRLGAGTRRMGPSAPDARTA